MTKIFITARIALILLFIGTAEVWAQSPTSACKVGKQAPAVGFWTWPAEAHVKVFVVTADFKREDLPYLLAPFQKWSAVATATNSAVTFDYAGEVAEQRSCENCLTIMRGKVFDSKKRHATELRAYSAHSNQIITYAAIVIDRELTNARALTNAVAHELGHNFGLLDCYSCSHGTTVMNQFPALNVPNEMEGPTACDVAQVKRVYKELQSKMRLYALAVDEGEEPADDDTPVVVPQP